MFLWHETPDLAALNMQGAGCMHGHIGLEFVDIGEDWLRARLPVDDRTRQPHGLLHGGASVVLAESVASVAGSLTVDPRVSRVVGLEINANHVRPATSGFVHAVATSEALGRRTQVWSIRIVDDADRLVCISRITLAVISVDPLV
ncbi:MAG: hotdog fold thioesterase [Reyranella sp.]|nr:hotdog fold thioesterase [Reyranella sp.]